MIIKDLDVRIKTIKEGYAKTSNRNNGYSGFEITVDQDGEEFYLFVGIENRQQCCEEWGYIISDDDINSFIDTVLCRIEVVDEALNTKIVDAMPDKKNEYKRLYGKTYFVNFVTNLGVLQFAAYNIHNGYYGHDVVIISNALDIHHTSMI